MQGILTTTATSTDSSKKRAKVAEVATVSSSNGKPQLRLDLALPPPEEFGGQQAEDEKKEGARSPQHTCGRASADHFLRPPLAMSPTKQQDQLQRERLELLGKKTNARGHYSVHKSATSYFIRR